MNPKLLKNIASGKLQPCSYCGKNPDMIAPFKFCGGCNKAIYCGKECQKKHWNTSHKNQCRSHDQAIGTPDESALEKLQKWQSRNYSGLSILAKLVTTPSKANDNILIVKINYDTHTADSIHMFQIEGIHTMGLGEAEALYGQKNRDDKTLASSCHTMVRDSLALATTSQEPPREYFFFLFVVKGSGLSFSLLACISSHKRPPKYNDVTYYLNAVNKGAGGLLSLDS